MMSSSSAQLHDQHLYSTATAATGTPTTLLSASLEHIFRFGFGAAAARQMAAIREWPIVRSNTIFNIVPQGPQVRGGTLW
jgi:hypothetical protein